MKYLITTIAAVVLVGCGEANLTKDALALISAVENGKIERVKQRIEAGTNVSPKEKYTGYTPLHYATQLYFKEIAELLIANGADVNAKCAHGGTVLDYLQHHNKKWV